MVNHVAETCVREGVDIQTNSRISSITKTADRRFLLMVEQGANKHEETFDSIVSTLPTPTLAAVSEKVLSAQEITKFKKLKYLGAANLIVEMEEKVFEKEYWVSMCTDKIPSLVFLQHTNFVDKSHYNGHNILYVASYCEPDDPLMHMSTEQMLEMYLPAIEKIVGSKCKVYDAFVWRAKHAQPIFDKDFLVNVPTFNTSDPHFFIANLDMTYPYDRGTNFAVKLGKDVAALVLQSVGV